MARRPLQLCRPDVAEIIDEVHRKEPPGWRKDRLLVIKLASRGELTSGKIADLAGICVSQVFTLVRSVREQGLESIWEKSGGGRPEGWRKGIPEEVSAEFERKLEANEFTTLTAAQRWLKEEHGLDLHYNRIWYWAKKLGGVLLVPRPSHSKKDDAASEAFPGQFAGKLQALNIPPGTRAKVWVMDEARLGLHTFMRKVWSKRGRRPVVAAQRKYEWDYLFGSLGRSIWNATQTISRILRRRIPAAFIFSCVTRPASISGTAIPDCLPTCASSICRPTAPSTIPANNFGIWSRTSWAIASSRPSKHCARHSTLSCVVGGKTRAAFSISSVDRG